MAKIILMNYSKRLETSDRVKSVFYKIVQNKLLYTASGSATAEIIQERSDVSKTNIRLTTWKGNKVRKGDVIISKNYLKKDELDTLNRIVTMYLDYAELQAINHRQMFTKDWQEKLNSFLQFNNQEILTNTGSITKKIADNLAIDNTKNEHRRLPILLLVKKGRDRIHSFFKAP